MGDGTPWIDEQQQNKILPIIGMMVHIHIYSWEKEKRNQTKRWCDHRVVKHCDQLLILSYSFTFFVVNIIRNYHISLIGWSQKEKGKHNNKISI